MKGCAARAASAGTVVIASAFAGTGCADVDEAAEYRRLSEETAESQTIYQAIPVAADDAYRVIVSDGTKQVEVLQSDTAVWRAGTGATDVGVAMMAEAEAVLLPTLAYRRLTVDADDPQFGLVGSDLSITVETRTAQRFDLTIGELTPNRGGYYAHRDDDPRVYVVIPQVRDYIRSILAGDRIVAPMSDQYIAALDALNATGATEEVINPWLAQVIAESSTDSTLASGGVP